MCVCFACEFGLACVRLSLDGLFIFSGALRCAARFLSHSIRLRSSDRKRGPCPVCTAAAAARPSACEGLIAILPSHSCLQSQPTPHAFVFSPENKIMTFFFQHGYSVALCCTISFSPLCYQFKRVLLHCIAIVYFFCKHIFFQLNMEKCGVIFDM